MKAMLIALALFAPAAAYADGSLPLDETNFVDAVQNLTKEQLVELLGQPASTIEVKDDRTGELIGYAWDYEYLNTSKTGDYYKTTELDLVDDRVVTIVFSNGKEDADPDNDTDTDGNAIDDNVAPGECTPSC